MSDFVFAPDDNLEDLGTTVTRYENNLAAIRILKEIEVDGRNEATLHEQTILSKYVGWGDSTLLKRAFPNGAHYSNIPPADEIKELLMEDEIKALRASSLNAHYISLPVIRAIYSGLIHAGLHQGNKARLRVLEPAAGIGHFIDEIVNNRVADEVARQLPVLVAEFMCKLESPSEFLDINELAAYWRMKGTAGIREWMRLPDDPLPYSLMGTDPRFHLPTVNDWAARRGRQQQTERTQKSLQIVDGAEKKGKSTQHAATLQVLASS